MSKRQKKSLAAILAALLVCMASVAAVPCAVSAEGEEKPVYHAAMGIQTATEIWIQRWGYYDSSYNEFYDTENFNKLYDSNKQFYNGNFDDVEIKGNGTYTVKLRDAEFHDETTVSQLHVATDIPVAESEKLQFTDVKLEVNGNEILQFDTAFMEQEENYMQGGAVILLLNHWREELIKMLGSKGRSENAANGWDILQGTGTENVSVTFTVSGLPYDNEEQLQSAQSENNGGEVISASDGNTDKAVKGDEKPAKGYARTIGIVVFGLIVLATLVGLVLHYKKRISH